MKKLVNGALVDLTAGEIAARQAEEAASTPSLEAVKDRLRAQIDRDAELARLRYITPGAAMAMTYQEKHAQARAVDAMGEAAANALSEVERTAQFPTLAASVGSEANTLWACAQLVIDKYEAWATISHVIESTRLTAKKAVGDAVDADAARTAYSAVVWNV